MKANPHHQIILTEIQKSSGVPTAHTFDDSYLGNTHPRYAINAPKMRAIAKSWAASHRNLSATEFSEVISSLIKGASSTEKIIAGMLMDYATVEQISFDPKLFDDWLEHLEGWAEVDALCSGKYSVRALPKQLQVWEKQLNRFAKSKNIQKRRASLVLLVSPVRYISDDRLRSIAFHNIGLLSDDKHIMITKAISWLLRSMVKLYKTDVSNYVKENVDRLPPIALRETLVKLKTGRKTNRT